MEKPTILKLKETEESLINIINTCELPIFILKPVIEKILNQLQILEQQELTKEIDAYNKALKEAKKESDK